MPHERYERSLGRPWRRTQQYQQTTAPAFPAAQPLVPRAPVDLAPGEELTTRTPVRAQSVESDVAVPALQAIMYGGGAALVAIPFTVFIDPLPWYTPLVVWPFVTGASVFVTSVLAHKLLRIAETWIGTDLDGDGRVGQEPTINLNAVLQEGQTSHLARTRMPLSQVKNWRAFCYAYTNGDCEFSARAAKSFHVEDVYTQVLGDWTSPDNKLALIETDSIGERLTPEPTPRGKAMIAIYGNTPLQDLGAMLQRYTGAGRQQTDREE